MICSFCSIQAFLLNEMEEGCLYRAVMMHASVSSPLIIMIWALICRRAMSPSDQMWLQAIGASVKRRRGWALAALVALHSSHFSALSDNRPQWKRLRVLPTVKLIELVIRRVETSIRPEEATVHPCLHLPMTKEQPSPEALTGYVVSLLEKMSPDAAELLWACDFAVDCVRHAVTLLAHVRGIILESNWICSQIHHVEPKITILYRGQIFRLKRWSPVRREPELA